MNVELGGGVNPKEDFYNIDCFLNDKVDVVHDLNDGIPLEDGVVDEIYSRHCLEHLDDFIKIMCEIHRVLKPGGVVTIIVPYGVASMIPIHKVFFTWRSFDLFIKDNENFGVEFLNLPRFKCVERRLDFGVGGMRLMKPFGLFFSWLARNRIHVYEWYFKCIFPAYEMKIKLKK